MVEGFSKTLSLGDRIEIGDVTASRVEQQRGGGIRFIATHDPSEAETYVVLRAQFTDSESLDFPEESQILAVTDGVGSHGAPTAWAIVPESAYGGGE